LPNSVARTAAFAVRGSSIEKAADHRTGGPRYQRSFGLEVFLSALTCTSLGQLAFACHFGGSLRHKDLTAFYTTLRATRHVPVAAAPEAGLD
jgi:hypothetical protein